MRIEVKAAVEFDKAIAGSRADASEKATLHSRDHMLQKQAMQSSTLAAQSMTRFGSEA